MLNLGDKVRDRVTGYTGIVVARTEWLYGCVRYVVQSQELHDGRPIDNVQFDEECLKVLKADALKDKTVKDTGGDRHHVPTRR
jgi:hypothetical protein